MSRMDHTNNDSNSTTSSRLASLQRFQITILKHALQFPAVQRVVYSTCSIYEEENEAVVAEVAEQVCGNFQVKKIFPELSHRGKGSSEISKNCLRMSPKKDLTNGFFVACFERVREGGDSGVDSKEICEANETSMKRKNRKRKHTDGGSVGVSEADNNSFSVRPISGLSEGTEDAEESCGSTKKRKKAKNSKRDTPKDQNGAAQQNGTLESCCLQDGEMDASTSGSGMAKKSKKKEQKERQATQPESALSLQNGTQELESTTADSLCVTDEASKAKKKKKKQKERHTTQSKRAMSVQKRAQELEPSICDIDETSKTKKEKKWTERQTAQCKSAASGTQEVESLTAGSLCVTDETPGKKKKKKKQVDAVEHVSLSGSLQTQAKKLTPPIADFNSVTDEASKNKRKKKKRKCSQIQPNETISSITSETADGTGVAIVQAIDSMGQRETSPNGTTEQESCEHGPKRKKKKCKHRHSEHLETDVPKISVSVENSSSAEIKKKQKEKEKLTKKNVL